MGDLVVRPETFRRRACSGCGSRRRGVGGRRRACRAGRAEVGVAEHLLDAAGRRRLRAGGWQECRSRCGWTRSGSSPRGRRGGAGSGSSRAGEGAAPRVEWKAGGDACRGKGARGRGAGRLDRVPADRTTRSLVALADAADERRSSRRLRSRPISLTRGPRRRAARPAPVAHHPGRRARSRLDQPLGFRGRACVGACAAGAGARRGGRAIGACPDSTRCLKNERTAATRRAIVAGRGQPPAALPASARGRRRLRAVRRASRRARRSRR
jgi:hypothetical protein